jgi:hypothetical protein
MGWNGSLWSETPGTFRAIGSDGRDAVWAAGTDDGLYRWASPARQWQAATVLPRDVRGLAVGPGDVPWVLTAQGQVQVFRSGAWSDIPGVVASSIAVGPEGTVYATDARDQSIFWLDPRERSWKPATGKATSMAVGPGGAPWAIGPGNTLMASEQFLRDDEAGVTAAAAASTPPASGQPASGMTITPGPLPALQSVLSFRSLGVAAVGFQALGIGGNGAVFGVSSAGNLFCFSNQSQRFLLASTGRASRVAVTADGLPWLLNASGVVSRFEKGAWTLVPEFLGREISVSPDGGVWALDVQGNPYRYARSSNRFERLVVTASDAPVKARRIAGANGGAYWLVTEANQLSWCDKGTCKTQLIGVQDVGVAPDNTAYVLDLLGSVRRFNPRTREFERQNGVGVAMAVGPQGLPWLVTRDGDVSIAGLFNPTSRSVNTDACAAPFSVAPAPVEPVTAQFRVPDISATAAPGGVVQILGQSTFNGRPVALADVSIVFSASTPLLTLRDGLVRIDPAAAPGSQLQATFNVCPARAVGACASAKLSVAVGIVPVAPTGVVATLGNARASISFNPPSDSGGSPVTGYIVTTSPGGLTATGSHFAHSDSRAHQWRGLHIHRSCHQCDRAGASQRAQCDRDPGHHARCAHSGPGHRRQPSGNHQFCCTSEQWWHCHHRVSGDVESGRRDGEWCHFAGRRDRAGQWNGLHVHRQGSQRTGSGAGQRCEWAGHPRHHPGCADFGGGSARQRAG